jgi:hypothetical protein
MDIASRIERELRRRQGLSFASSFFGAVIL